MKCVLVHLLQTCLDQALVGFGGIALIVRVEVFVCIFILFPLRVNVGTCVYISSRKLLVSDYLFIIQKGVCLCLIKTLKAFFPSSNRVRFIYLPFFIRDMIIRWWLCWVVTLMIISTRLMKMFISVL